VAASLFALFLTLASFLIAGVILYESMSYFYLLDFSSSGVKTYEATGQEKIAQKKIALRISFQIA